MGAGISIQPLAFLVVSNGDVRLLQMTEESENTVDRMVNLVPDVIDKIGGLISGAGKDKKENSEKAQPKAE